VSLASQKSLAGRYEINHADLLVDLAALNDAVATLVVASGPTNAG
jgi:hypothetical protein